MHTRLFPRIGMPAYFFSAIIVYGVLSGDVVAGPARNLTILPLPVAEETVFPKAASRCNIEHIPDSPARAFRSADKKVFLFASHYTNQPFIGSTLDDVRPDCSLGFKAGMEPDPEKYNARTWLQTFYTDDGRTVYSIGSSDYHGTWFKNCDLLSKGNPKCWWSALTLAISKDGGKTFTSAASPNHVIAKAPYGYTLETEQPMGFFTSSNIVKKSDFYYTLVFTFGYKGQKRGNCLIRTNDLSNPSSWHSWNGTGFKNQFVSSGDPAKIQPEDYACLPVTGLGEPVRSLLWHEPSGQYVAVFSATRRVKNSGADVAHVAFRFMTSRDLIVWSAPKDIISFDSPSSCKRGIAPAAYPSIIDPSSADINFGTVSNSAYLYFTRFKSEDGCQMTMDRNLVRVPIKITMD